MKLGMTLFLSAVLNTVIQDSFLGVKASQNDLIIHRDDVLLINTTTPSINCTRCSGITNFTLQNRSSSHGSHLVANITFNGNIEFRSGSTVEVFGKYALSITSLNGNISIQTDVNMTCVESVFDETCLGGFTQNSSLEKVGSSSNTDVYKGLGPGGLKIEGASAIPNLKIECVPGSSHGGKTHGPKPQSIYSGPSYGKNNTESLLGGSGGSCMNSPGSVAGGGAIELVAQKGEIAINATIRASAQKANSSSICSGGSGGLIRLKAKKIQIQEKGRLDVQGGDGQQPSSSICHLGGGAGGNIQIIASEVYLAPNTAFMKGGANQNSFCKRIAEDGCFLLKVNDNADPIFINSTRLALPYSWPPSSSTSGASSTIPLPTSTEGFMTTKSFHASSTVLSVQSTVSLTSPDSKTKEPLSTLMEELKSIKMSLEQGNQVNKSAFREVLNKHQSLASSVTLNRDVNILCLQIFKEYEAIIALIAKGEPSFVEEPLQNILEVASDCLETKQDAFWKQNQEMPNLMKTLEDIFGAVVEGNFPTEVNYTISTKTVVAVVIRNVVASDIKEFKIPNYVNIKGKSWKDVSDFVLIPKDTVINAKENYSYVFLLYKNVKDGMPSKATSGSGDDLLVSSLVMSCFLKLDGKPVYDLLPPAVLTFTTSSAEDHERECLFWDFKNSFWSNDGVQELKSNSSSTHTVCQTDHFTSFAVLMQHKEITLSEDDMFALSIITYISCGVSTAALFLTGCIFFYIGPLSSERHKIHKNLVLSLFVANVLFLVGIEQTSNQVLCKIFAVLLHYFFLAAFAWMFVEGLHLFRKVVRVFGTENINMLYYYLLGWGSPIIAIAVALPMRLDSYGNSKICWLSTEDKTIWAFIAPVIVIITMNIFFLVMAVKTVVRSASAVTTSDREHIKAGAKALLFLIPILGVGWILGPFALNKGTIGLVYAFAIINGSQGLLIFLFHCVGNSEVRQAWRRKKEKSALSKENYSRDNASFSRTHSDSGSKKASHSNSFDRLKASFSFKRKSAAKVVQVQPMSESQDITESSLQVKRAFQDNRLSKPSLTDGRNETSSLNCPMEAEEVSVSPERTRSMKQQTATKRQHSRPPKK